MSYPQLRRLAAQRMLEPDLRNSDGGWGATRYARSSIVNTAEAVGVLATVGHQYESEEVQAAIAFLRKAVREHSRGAEQGGRGEWTRYVTYTILGLTEYQAWRSDSESLDTLQYCHGWLSKTSYGGGWRAHRGRGEASIFCTATTIIALARLGVTQTPLVQNACDALLALRLEESGVWPNTAGGDEPSAAKTALACIALARARPAGDDAATLAADWLSNHPETWQRMTTIDAAMEGVRWTHMLFALGTRACLTMPGVSAGDPRIIDTVEYLSELWDAPQRLWREGADPASPASVIATAAVVRTYESYGKALADDPAAAAKRIATPARITEMSVIAQPLVQFRRGDQTQQLDVGRRPWEAIAILAAAHRDGSPVLSREAAAKQYGQSLVAFDRAVGRINEATRREGLGDIVARTYGGYRLIVDVTTNAPANAARDVTMTPKMATLTSIQERSVGDLLWYQYEHLAPYPGLRHGVFSRHGGASQVPFDSLNVSTIGDDLENVQDNRARIASALGVPIASMIWPRLVHGDTVLKLSGLTDASTAQLQPADAIITDLPGLTVVMGPADCAVLTMFDPEHSAMGLVHAGWKGIVACVATKAIDEMADCFGTRVSELRIGIGPSIGPCHYRLADAAQKALPDWAPYLEDLEDGTTAIDLPGRLASQLLDHGVSRANLVIDRRCTACHVDTFFSSRIERPITGRFAVVAGLVGSDIEVDSH